MKVYRVLQMFNIDMQEGYYHFGTKKEAEDFQREMAVGLFNSQTKKDKLKADFILKKVKVDCPIKKLNIKTKSEMVHQLNYSAQTL